MSKKQQLLDNLKKITEKPAEQVSYQQVTVSSNMGRDRIYQQFNGQPELINKNNTRYSGKISRRSITCVGLDGSNFRSYVYETADGRWFDRAGLAIVKPNNLVGNDKGNEDTTDEITE
jgi:hypothetical protein